MCAPFKAYFSKDSSRSSFFPHRIWIQRRACKGGLGGGVTMAPAKAVLKLEPTDELVERIIRSPQILSGQIPPRLPNALAGIESPRPLSTAHLPAAMPTARPRRDTGATFQARVPIVTGEAIFRGWMAVDGTISGQLGASGSTLSIKQRPRGGPVEKQP